MDGTLPPEELEGRLIAQRRLLQWLLGSIVSDRDALEDLRRHLGATDPILDHQEDPGAVPTPAFAIQAATAAELRLLLAPVEATLDGRGED